MATSTIPVTKTAVFALLRATAGLDGIQIEWAQPSEDALRPESIWFEGTESAQTVEAIGNQRRDETYVIKLLVSVLQNGDDAKGCELRMWALVAAIEAAVRANPKPPGRPVELFDIQFAGANQVPSQGPGQRISEAVVSIAARSRI